MEYGKRISKLEQKDSKIEKRLGKIEKLLSNHLAHLTEDRRLDKQTIDLWVKIVLPALTIFAPIVIQFIQSYFK